MTSALESSKATGARSAPQIVYGFPRVACISINEEAIHGIPRTTNTVRPGDLVKLDVTAELDGYVADSAVTVAVDNASPTARADCQSTPNLHYNSPLRAHAQEDR